MTSASDSIVFRHLFSTSESSAIWSDEKRTQYYLNFEGALATVQGNLGIIPKEAGEIIPSKCHVELIDMNKVGEETKKIGYPVLPLVKQLVRCVNNSANGIGEWAHWGATTQDVTDTATVLQLRDTLLLVSSTLDKIIETLRELSLKYKSTPMAARSNLQQAVPMTFEFKLARLLATFQRHQQRLAEIMPRISVLEFGGAAGTLASNCGSRRILCAHNWNMR